MNHPRRRHLAGRLALCFLLQVGVAHAQATATQATKSRKAPRAEAKPGVAAAPETITVHADRTTPRLAGRVSSGALGSRSELDTPFSVHKQTAAVIAARQADDINAVFNDDPAITVANSGEAAASGSTFKVRGITLDNLNGYKIDGLAIPYWSIDIPVENVDSITLLKGASAFMYGFGSPGGVLDFTLKQPTDTRIATATVGWRSASLFRQSFDLGGKLDRNDRVEGRLSYAHEEGDTFNSGYSRRDSLDAAVRLQITPNLHWENSLFVLETRQTNLINTLYAASTVTVLPSISGTTQLGAEGSWKTNDMQVATSRLIWDLGPNWSNTLSYRYARLDENFPGSLVTLTDNAGDYKTAAFFIEREWWYDQVQDIAEGHVRTGPFSHDIVLGASWENQIYDTDANASTTTIVDTGNIYESTPTLANYSPASNYDPKPYRYIEYQQLSPFASDTVSWHAVSLLFGLRYTEYVEHDYATTGAVTGSHNDHPLTPVAALTVRIAPGTNLYASYVRAMQSGSQAPAGTTNYNQAFAPIESSQYEVGVKTQQRSWMATAALFRVDEGAAYTNAANTYVENGQARLQGVEASLQWRPLRSLTLQAGTQYLDARYRQTTSAYVGHRIEGTPRWQVTGGARYALPWVPSLSLDADMRYVGDMYDNAANTLLLPSYMTWDLGASWSTRLAGRQLVLRALVRNLAGSRYWITYGNTALLPGDPRTIDVSARVEF